MRLLHARVADERDVFVAPQPEPERDRDPSCDPRQYLPLHGLCKRRPIDRRGRAGERRYRRRGAGDERRRTQGGSMNASGPAAETTIRPAESAEKIERWAGQNVPRREDRRLLQGQGEFTDDVW